MSKYYSSAHTTHRLMSHIVWIPKYRKRVLRGPLAGRLYELLRQCAEVNGWSVEELNIQVDHIHLLVQLPPREAVAHAVQLMKGGTSKVIRAEFPELEEFLWGDSLWADGYFTTPLNTIKIKKRASYAKKPKRTRKISFARRAFSAAKPAILRVIISFLSVAQKRKIVRDS